MYVLMYNKRCPKKKKKKNTKNEPCFEKSGGKWLLYIVFINPQKRRTVFKPSNQTFAPLLCCPTCNLKLPTENKRVVSATRLPEERHCARKELKVMEKRKKRQRKREKKKKEKKVTLWQGPKTTKERENRTVGEKERKTPRAGTEGETLQVSI